MSKDLNTDAVIDRLFETVASRKGGDAAESYTAKLFARGTDKIAQKLGEEAVRGPDLSPAGAVGRCRHSP